MMNKDTIPHSAFPTAPPGRRPHFKVLVVDDDPRWRALIAEVLQEAGGEVTTAAGPEAELSGYDLAVLDLGLDLADPDRLEGLDLISRLVSVGTPCIVVSGRAEAEMPANLLQSSRVVGALPKAAFRREALLDLARRALAAKPPAESSPVRLLIVEDDERWRGLYTEVLADAPGPGYALQFAVSYGEARGWLQRTEFALAVVDLHLVSSAAPQENRDGFWLLRAARQRGVPAVVVSALGAPEDIDRAYDEYGVFAFVEKEAFDRANFRRTVAEAIGASAGPRAISDGSRAPAPSAVLSQLTERERDVLDLLTQGRTNRQIAEVLCITPNTVKKHVDHILQKLGVSNRAAAVAIALRGG